MNSDVYNMFSALDEETLNPLHCLSNSVVACFLSARLDINWMIGSKISRETEKKTEFLIYTKGMFPFR